MAISHGAVDALVVLFDQIIDNVRLVRDLERLAHDLKKFSERRLFGIEHFDFVWNSSKKSVIHEVFGLEIRAKDNELIEGNLDFFTAAEA